MQATAVNQSSSVAQAAAQLGAAQTGTGQGGDFMQLIMQMMGQGSGEMESLMNASSNATSMEELLGLTGEQEDGEENTDYLMQIMAGMLGHGMPQVAMYNDGSGSAQQSADAAMEILSAVQAGLQSSQNPLQNVAQLPTLVTAANPEAQAGASAKDLLPDSKVIPFPSSEMSMEIVTEGYNKNGQTAVTKAEGEQNLIQNAFNSMSKPQQLTAQAANGKKTEIIDIDALQQAVDSGRYLSNATTAAQALSSANPQTMDILAQVKTGILANMNEGSNEFVIKLKPEGLGEITVKMTEVAGKVSLSIITSSQQAQNALSSEISSLREALRPYNAEVSQVITQQDANLSQGFGEHRHGSSGQEQHENRGWMPQTEDDPQQVEYVSALKSALNAYI